MLIIIIKILIILFSIIGLIQKQFSQIEYFLICGFVFSFFSLFLYLLKKEIVWFWIPILFFLITFRIYLTPVPPPPPEIWLKAQNNDKINLEKKDLIKLYVKVTIDTIIKPGSYIANLEITKAYDEKNLAYEKDFQVETKLIKIYFQGNDFYLSSGCRVVLKLEKKSLPTQPPTNSFGEYLISNGVDSIVRFNRENIFFRDCRNLGLRGSFQNNLSKILTKAKFDFYERGVAFGLILGRASYIDPELKNKAKMLGILHLFAASGLHLALVYVWFFFPISFFLGKKTNTHY